jgi:hypothetical protein
VTAIIPYLFVLLYGFGRDIFMMQALNGAAGFGVMAALLPFAPLWAPIAGLGAGSIVSVVATVQRARKRAARADLFRPAAGVATVDRQSLSAPFIAGAAFFLPAPLYLRAGIAFIVWVALAHRSVLRLLREAG